MDALRKNLATIISTFFYVGTAPVMRGTFGSVAAIPFAWYLWKLPMLFAWGIFVVALLISIWAAGEYVRITGKEDNQRIVVDEVLGMFVTTCIAFPHWTSYVAALALFRIFDIFKPWPVSWADSKVHGGFGVILDDLIAGVYAMLCLWGLQYWYGEQMLALSF